jgi:hypothetical protein
VKIRHSAVGALLVVTALALSAGCGTKTDSGGSGGASPTPSPTLSAVDQLKASTKDLTSTSHKFSAKDSSKEVTGASDPSASAASLSATFTAQGTKFTIDFLFYGTDRYVKISGLPIPGVDGKKWLRIDISKIKDPSKAGPTDVKDPVALKAFTDAIVTAEKTGDKSFKGTVDAAKATDEGIFDQDVITGLADKAKAVPFEATLDEKGRLSTIKVTVPAFGDKKEDTINVTVSDYGTATVTKPAAADVVDAPAAVYQILNG